MYEITRNQICTPPTFYKLNITAIRSRNYPFVSQASIDCILLAFPVRLFYMLFKLT
eukprot:TRINITY_DN17537_c0_g1_i1.p1 TRINITY_DN17537_c0_g1~~TRINITY_DN17537_c0_g1_i1.p1  ORF type:complete len:56 (-),score=2.34 TRINITY_DN17537_c0_g1_i1:131-298(-)